jgi:hypothetical protein
MGDPTNLFMVGTIENPTDLDSHAWRNKWTVNCVNHWVATLGSNLNVKNAIRIHSLICLHELTHALSGIRHGDRQDQTASNFDWDDVLYRIVDEQPEVFV